MHPHESAPRARKDGLLEETVGEELLLYDRDNHTAHCLSPIAAAVWRHCDGERDLAELAELAGVNESMVAGALHELREKDLLAAVPELIQSVIPGISRREAISRVARVGAAAAAGSLIVSATAATPAMASSGEAPPVCKNGATGETCCLCNDNIGCMTGLTEEGCEKYCANRKGEKSFQTNKHC
jgi:hypothetical protein